MSNKDIAIGLGIGAAIAGIAALFLAADDSQSPTPKPNNHHHDVIMRECRRCPRFFAITPREKKFFLARGLQLPTHCPSCRQERRAIGYARR